MPGSRHSLYIYIYVCVDLKGVDAWLDCIAASLVVRGDTTGAAGLVSVEHPVLVPSLDIGTRHKRGSRAKKRTQAFHLHWTGFIVGNPIYMQHRPIFGKKKEKLFFVPPKLIKSPFIFVILHPFEVFIDQPKSCRLGPSSRKDRRWHFRNCRSRKKKRKEKQKLPSDKLVYWISCSHGSRPSSFPPVYYHTCIFGPSS